MSNVTNRTKNICAFVIAFSLILPAVWPAYSLAVKEHASEPAVADWAGLGELIEAPADATVHVSFGDLGSAVLASATKARLTTLPAAGAAAEAFGQPSVLAATVLSGDLIVKLQPQARAVVKIGETVFSAARGSLFHAGWRNGKAFIDASDSLGDRLPELGNWAIKLPAANTPAALPGNWPINPFFAPVTDSAASVSSVGGSLLVEKTGLINPNPVAATRNFSAALRPIGRIEASLGVVKINQTAASQRGIIWGGELIQAPDGASARATFDNIGQVILSGGSQARLTTPMAGGADGHRVLAASLLSGTLAVQLEPSVAGYAEAAGSTFLASRGARFRVLVVEGRAIFEMIDGTGLDAGWWMLSVPTRLAELRGSATQDPTAAARRYIVRPVGLNSNLVVQARSTRQIQVRVTDENDRPIPGVPIIFSLGSSTAGSTTLGAFAAGAATARIFTDAQGIATTDFTAGPAAAAGSISATVEGTNFSWVGQINLIKVTPGFWAPQNMVPVMVTAATAVTIGTIKAATKDDPVPIKPTGTTIIKP